MTTRSRISCRVGLRRVLWVACASLWFAPASVASALTWDARDVAAADAYRSAERDRADRYRARIHASPPSGRESAPEPRPRVERPEPRRSEGVVSKLIARAGGAVLEEFDREAIESAARRAHTSLRWWQSEGSPRASRALEWIADIVGSRGE